MLNDGCGSARLQSFGSLCFATHYQKEDVTLSTFGNNIVACIVPLLLNSIGQLISFVCIYILQNRYFLEELLIFFAFLLCRILDDEVESSSVKSPQF